MFDRVVNSGANDTATEPDIVEPPAATEPVGELPVRVLHKADYNIDDQPTVRGYQVLSEVAAYADALKKLSVEFPATINFDENRVVLATMGTQPSGGYSISAGTVTEYADKVVVQIDLVSPADNCLTTAALSNPYEFALVPTVKPIEFTEETRIQSCE